MTITSFPPPASAIRQDPAWQTMFNQLVADLYAGVLENNPWQTFARNLRAWLDCDAAGLTFRQATAGSPSISLWECREPMPDHALREAAAHRSRFAHLDPLAQALTRPGEILNLDDVIDREQLAETAYYREFLQHYQLEYQLAMCIAEPGGWTCHLGLINGSARRNFDERDKQYLRELQPHLEHALSLYAALQQQILHKEIYRDALNKLAIGTIILNRAGRVLDVSQAAQEMIEKCSSLSLVDGQVVPVRAEQRYTLRRMIAAAAVWSEQRRKGAFVDVLRMEDQHNQHLGLVVRSSPSAPWYPSETGPSVILHLSGIDDRSTLESVVARLFGLTASEALLATRLADGLTISEAAAELGLTESSARTYSKRVFAKTGTNRQAELVRLVLKSVAPLCVQECLVWAG